MCGLTEAILLGNFSSSLTNYLRGKGGPVKVSLQGCLRLTNSGFQGSAQPIMRGHLSKSCDWGTSELWAHSTVSLGPLPWLPLLQGDVAFNFLLCPPLTQRWNLKGPAVKGSQQDLVLFLISLWHVKLLVNHREIGVTRKTGNVQGWKCIPIFLVI